MSDKRERDKLALSGQKLTARYHLRGNREEASAIAWDICLEQTVEYPFDLIDRQDIRDQIVGRVSDIERIEPDLFMVEIEFPVETVGDELPQLLNILFGNISLKQNIRLVGFELHSHLLKAFHGPLYGRSGVRDRLGITDRPLLCTALKPMGLSSKELAQLAYQFALSGIDLIKDDHGLSNQTFCPFDERIRRCCEAVDKANRKTGLKCSYLPNVTARTGESLRRALLAREAGAGGIVISPGLIGLDTMRDIADHPDVALPILSHPSMLGAFTIHRREGISHGALYGQINRLAGADAVIFPNFGGRFPFTSPECQDIVEGTSRPMGHIKPIFPVPAGGMTLDRIPEILRFYGNDTILLIGGDLHRHGSNLMENCSKFLKLITKS